MVQADGGSLAAELSAELCRLLGGRAPSVEPGWDRSIGVEHEFQIVRDGIQLDFRELVHDLGLGVRHLDPSDPFAYHLPTGSMLTCDYREAEIATPPIRAAPGFTGEVAGRARSERLALESRLGPAVRAVGYSTHVSVSMDDAITERAGLHYARTFGPALMLLLNRSGSPGLMVRPRPGRLELCGEFTHGSRLRGALAFVLGSAIAAERSVTGEPGPDQPPSVRLELEPAYERYGWYVDRRAAGADLHASGRTTVLRLEAGGSIDAQSHLELAAEAARACLVDLADADDLEPLQQMVAGDLSLPSEGPAGPERGDEGAADDGPGTTLLDPDPFGALLAPRRRVAFELAPVMVSWATCAFVFTDPARTARGFACVPRRHLSRFLVLLDAGGLDSLLGRYLAVAGDGTPLATAGQAREPGLFGSLGRRLALLPPEPGAADPSSVADASRPGRRDDSAHEAGAGRPQ